MLRLFVTLFGGHQSMATEVFLSVENQTSKTAAINAAAEYSLRDRRDSLRVLQAILSLLKSNGKERNKLAHWTWGDSASIPDGLLLVDPRTTMEDIDRDRVFVYRAADFLSIIEANDRLCGYGLSFRWILDGHPPNAEELIAELLAEPELAGRLPADPE